MKLEKGGLEDLASKPELLNYFAQVRDKLTASGNLTYIPNVHYDLEQTP